MVVMTIVIVLHLVVKKVILQVTTIIFVMLKK